MLEEAPKKVGGISSYRAVGEVPLQPPMPAWEHMWTPMSGRHTQKEAKQAPF